MVEPRDRAQPPPVRRSWSHLPPARSVFVVDVPHPPLPLREHLLRLGNPFEAVLVALGHDQLPLSVGIAGRRGGLDDVNGFGPTREVRDVVDPLNPREIGPDQVGGTRIDKSGKRQRQP